MRRSMVWLVVAGLLVGTLGWWMFLMSPERSATSDAQAELDAAQIREATIRSQIAQLTDIIDNEITYRFAIGEMETAIPVQPQADVFIDDLTFLAQSTGIDIFSINMSPPAAIDLSDLGQPGVEAYQVSVSITAQGQYFEVLGFLYGLEAMDRLVRVDSIGLSPEQVAQDQTAPEETDESTTTTTVAEPRLRPEPDVLGIDLSLRIFTRTGTDLTAPADTEATTTTAGDTTSDPEAAQ
jgi:Tfp pilus assembly protein PilO